MKKTEEFMGEEVEPCIRFVCSYRDDNLYVISGPKKIHLSMANRDEHLTEAGLNLVARLLTLLIEKEVSEEELAGICWEESFGEAGKAPKDLPGILSQCLASSGKKYFASDSNEERP